MKQDEIPEDLWIFGYGSIVWKYDEIHHTQKETGFIRGFRRRFWQNSPDHRGTKENPGLVASIYSQSDMNSTDLLKKDNKEIGSIANEWVVGGRAFRVTQQYRQQVCLFPLVFVQYALPQWQTMPTSFCRLVRSKQNGLFNACFKIRLTEVMTVLTDWITCRTNTYKRIAAAFAFMFMFMFVFVFMFVHMFVLYVCLFVLACLWCTYVYGCR